MAHLAREPSCHVLTWAFMAAWWRVSKTPALAGLRLERQLVAFDDVCEVVNDDLFIAAVQLEVDDACVLDTEDR